MEPAGQFTPPLRSQEVTHRSGRLSFSFGSKALPIDSMPPFDLEELLLERERSADPFAVITAFYLDRDPDIP